VRDHAVRADVRLPHGDEPIHVRGDDLHHLRETIGERVPPVEMMEDEPSEMVRIQAHRQSLDVLKGVHAFLEMEFFHDILDLAVLAERDEGFLETD